MTDIEKKSEENRDEVQEKTTESNGYVFPKFGIIIISILLILIVILAIILQFI